MKASFTNMKLKVNNSVKTFQFAGQTIEVLQYLPAQDKYDLIMVALQNAIEEGNYNEFKLNTYFELYLVYMYTNISFTEKQRENELKIYDQLKSNGFFEKFYAVLPEDEYNELLNTIQIIKEDNMKYRASTAAVLNNVIDNLPKNAEAAAKIVESFDPNQFKAVVDFARAANGGRDIKTNQQIITE